MGLFDKQIEEATAQLNGVIANAEKRLEDLEAQTVQRLAEIEKTALAEVSKYQVVARVSIEPKG